MRLLLKNAHLVDPEQGETRIGQIFIENGIISSFENQAAERVIECNGKYLAPGFSYSNFFINARRSDSSRPSIFTLTSSLIMILASFI